MEYATQSRVLLLLLLLDIFFESQITGTPLLPPLGAAEAATVADTVADTVVGLHGDLVGIGVGIGR